jgi:Tol biopolymer transport system component
MDVGWSSDGNSLVFGSYPAGDARAAAIDILDLRTHQISRLPGSTGIYSPHWSPDGRHIAAIIALEFNKLMLYDFTTKKWSVLAKTLIGWPNWSRDGKYVYFDSSAGTETTFYRVRPNDGRLEQLFATKDLRRTGTDLWTGLAPDDSPLLLRDVGTQEVYALDVELH